MAVPPFEEGRETLREAENQFFEALTNWKDRLHESLQNIAGTMLPQNINEMMTDVESPSERKCFSLLRCFPFFKRKQRTATLDAECKHQDNHYSYMEPTQYLDFRVKPLIKVYQDRLPKSKWMQRKYELLIILLGVAIAYISQIDIPNQANIVIIITGVMTAIQSWSEFRQLENNYDLYPSAISTCKTKEEEWKKIIKHCHQDAKLAEELVTSIEAICINVVESWSSSLSVSNQKKKDEKARNGESEPLFPVRQNPTADAQV